MASNASVNLEELQRKFLECSICFEMFDEENHHPRLLPCLHTFCYLCLENLHIDGKIICPLCKTTHKVTDGLNAFQKDNTRRDLLDFVKASSKKTLLCEMCDKKDIATHHCNDCKYFICENCVQIHTTVISYKSHQPVPLQNDSVILLEHLERFAHKSFCKEEGHESKEIEIYCSSCQKPICTFCVLTSHLNHKISIISKEFEDDRKKLSDAALVVKGRISSIDKILGDIQNECHGINLKSKEEKEKNRGVISKGREIIQRVEKDICRSIDTIESRKIRILENQCSELQKLKESCVEACEFLDFSLMFENHAAFLEVWPSIEGRMEKLQSATYDSNPRTQAKTFKVSKEENFLPLQKVTDDLGKLLNSDVYEPNCSVINAGKYCIVGSELKIEFILRTVDGSIVKNENVKIVIVRHQGDFLQIIDCHLDNDTYRGKWIARKQGIFTWHVTNNDIKIQFPNNIITVKKEKKIAK
ncbi:E3 ubiquitin-protein ligase TRIM56-like [Saccostrea cucullata]|uniref:E3 ubiquitin-protein ligase TRIM56-like n=1 Tax=Saccostrea cuccullata TaxID=36930 RepID=UPI002ED17009